MCRIALHDYPHLTEIPDFGHFILLDGMNSVFGRLINTFIHLWLLASCPKNLAFARKMMALPDLEGWGLQPPGSYGD